MQRPSNAAGLLPRAARRGARADEIWTFAHTKEKRIKESDLLEYGDAYVWIALDSETKAVLSYYGHCQVNSPPGTMPG